MELHKLNTINPAFSAAWQAFAFALPGNVPLAPPKGDPDFIRYTGGFLYSLVTQGLHFIIDTPADIVKLVRLVQYIFKPGEALTELGRLIGEMMKGINLVVSDFRHIPAYNRGKAVGSLLVGIVGLFYAGKGAIALIKLARNLPKALKAALLAVKSLPASIENSKNIVGLVGELGQVGRPR